MSVSLIIAGYSLAFLLAFSLSVFLFIVIRRILLRRRFLRTEAVSERLETDILTAMSSPDERAALAVAEQYADDPKVLIRVLVDYLKTISGPERDRLKLIYLHTLRDRLLLQIRSRFTHVRLRAIRPFILFAEEADFPLIMSLIRDKPPVRLAVIDALSSIPHPFVISRLFQAFSESPELDLRAYMNVMYSLGKRIEDQVREHLSSDLPAPKLEILIELAGALPLPNLYDRVLALADFPDMEVRTRVARALGRMAIPVKVVADTLIKLAEDETWEVQAQALKSLGRLHIHKALDTLHRGLFSPNWYCRRNAGFSLANLGEPGVLRLRQTAAQDQDRYAADMARMVMEDMAIPTSAG